jgi:hypothetical protein
MIGRMTIIGGFLLAVASGCATTGGANSPEQQALDTQYRALEQKRNGIQAQERKVKGKAKTLFTKATKLEKQRSVAKNKSLLVKGGGAGSLKVGPIKLDKKSAAFTLVPQGGSGGVVQLSVNPK